MTGWGTKTCWRPGIPFTLATDRTTRSNLSVWTATVGTPYWASIVIACAATAGAQVLQCPTPTIAACPLARISSQVVGSSLEVDARDRLEDRSDAGHVLGEPRLHLLEEDVRVVEAAIHEADGLPVERVQTRRQLLAGHRRREADRVQDRDLVVHSHGALPPG